KRIAASIAGVAHPMRRRDDVVGRVEFGEKAVDGSVLGHGKTSKPETRNQKPEENPKLEAEKSERASVRLSGLSASGFVLVSDFWFRAFIPSLLLRPHPLLIHRRHGQLVVRHFLLVAVHLIVLFLHQLAHLED